ncbi:hypothetical protein QE152_g37534 [Popillia japonica]|uniref:Uncharacterized protein n=1 Tax=Popillia japonica TaxID=7064 RepID=A0AAW1I9V2_POPJA
MANKIEDEQLQNPYSSIDQAAAESFDSYSNSDSLLQEEPGLEACFTKENFDCITQHTNQEMARQRLKYKSDRLTENDAVEDAVTSVRP